MLHLQCTGEAQEGMYIDTAKSAYKSAYLHQCTGEAQEGMYIVHSLSTPVHGGGTGRSTLIKSAYCLSTPVHGGGTGRYVH